MNDDTLLDQLPDEQGQLRLFLESAHSSVVAVDSDGLITYVNARAVETFGYQPEELVGTPADQFLPEPLTDDERAQQHEYLTHPYRVDLSPAVDLRVRAKDGRRIPVEIRLTPLEVADGIWTVAGITDLSARVAAEERSRAVGRAYRTLAELNQAIVRAPDARTLYAKTCRIAVELGGYLGAWVGVVEADGGVRPVARAGSLDAYIDSLDIRVDEADWRGRGPTAVALRRNRPTYSVDFTHEVEPTPWHAFAREHGVLS